jgi:hypothetical protein
LGLLGQWEGGHDTTAIDSVGPIGLVVDGVRGHSNDESERDEQEGKNGQTMIRYHELEDPEPSRESQSDPIS